MIQNLMPIKNNLVFIVLLMLIIVVNIPVVWKYAGLLGSTAYVIGYTVGFVALVKGLPSHIFWTRVALVSLVIAIIIQLFLLFYVAPIYDARMDRDDALILWWQRLFQGEFPYSEPTSLGNPISILPFLNIVALPFIILGNVGLIIVACTLALVYLLWQRFAGDRTIQSLTILSFITSPVVYLEVAGRSDIAINVLLLVFVILLIETVVSGSNPRLRVFLAIIIGALGATRIAIWPALAVVVFYLLYHSTLKQNILIIVTSLLSFLALVGPFIIWQPFTFWNYAPFGVNLSKLGTESWDQGIFLVTCGFAVIGSSLYSIKKNQLFISVLPPLTIVVISTWITFFYDVTYVQFLSIPLLFCFPRKVLH